MTAAALTFTVRKAPAAVAAALALLALCGCATRKPVLLSERNIQSAGSHGLVVSMELPHTRLSVGEQLTVTITARNTTKSPIRIDSAGADLVQVKIYQNRMAGYELVKQYPQAALGVLVPWTLAPGQQRTWRLNLTVEPDWPQAEHLRFVGMLNGRPDAAVTMLIYVSPGLGS